MRCLLTLVLLGSALAGCSSRPDVPEKGTSPNDPDIANVAPEGPMTEEVNPDEADSSLPGMTANPPPILLTPVQGNTPAPSTRGSTLTENWQTFTSSALRITVNYPSDWSVEEQTDAVVFTSPTGTTIQLTETTAATDNNEFKVGNQYCTARTNEHGQTAEICVDNASFTYTANFTLPMKDGSTRTVMLITKTRAAGDVFEAMFNSLQPTS
jgi:hypothetical protein